MDFVNVGLAMPVEFEHSEAVDSYRTVADIVLEKDEGAFVLN